jgi:hypothetical protein
MEQEMVVEMVARVLSRLLAEQLPLTLVGVVDQYTLVQGYITALEALVVAAMVVRTLVQQTLEAVAVAV